MIEIRPERGDDFAMKQGMSLIVSPLKFVSWMGDYPPQKSVGYD